MVAKLPSSACLQLTHVAAYLRWRFLSGDENSFNACLDSFSSYVGYFACDHIYFSRSRISVAVQLGGSQSCDWRSLSPWFVV